MPDVSGGDSSFAGPAEHPGRWRGWPTAGTLPYPDVRKGGGRGRQRVRFSLSPLSFFHLFLSHHLGYLYNTNYICRV